MLREQVTRALTVKLGRAPTLQELREEVARLVKETLFRGEAKENPIRVELADGTPVNIGGWGSLKDQ